VRYGAWLAATFGVSLAATLVIVHRALALRPKQDLSEHYLAVWGIAAGGSLAFLAVIAGMCVFRRNAPWDIVLTWPWLAGLAVGLGYFFGLSDQTEGTSKLCDAPANSSCDNAWGLGAALFSLIGATVLGSLFIAALCVRRGLSRLLSQ
jgi:hypothetical protein